MIMRPDKALEGCNILLNNFQVHYAQSTSLRPQE